VALIRLGGGGRKSLKIMGLVAVVASAYRKTSSSNQWRRGMARNQKNGYSGRMSWNVRRQNEERRSRGDVVTIHYSVISKAWRPYVDWRRGVPGGGVA